MFQKNPHLDGIDLSIPSEVMDKNNSLDSSSVELDEFEGIFNVL